MADISWGEAVGGGVAGIITGIVATIKALGDRRNGDDRRHVNGNGNGYTKELHLLDKRVLTLELGLQGIGKTLDAHSDALEQIREAVTKHDA